MSLPRIQITNSWKAPIIHTGSRYGIAEVLQQFYNDDCLSSMYFMRLLPLAELTRLYFPSKPHSTSSTLRLAEFNIIIHSDADKKKAIVGELDIHNNKLYVEFYNFDSFPLIPY